MKELSANDAVLRIPYVIGLVFGGGIFLMISQITDCTNPNCSQIQSIALIISIGMIGGGFLLMTIILKSPKTKDIPSGSEYYLDKEETKN